MRNRAAPRDTLRCELGKRLRREAAGGLPHMRNPQFVARAGVFWHELEGSHAERWRFLARIEGFSCGAPALRTTPRFHRLAKPCLTRISFHKQAIRGTNSGLNTIRQACHLPRPGKTSCRSGMRSGSTVSNPKFVPRSSGFWNEFGVRHARAPHSRQLFAVAGGAPGIR